MIQQNHIVCFLDDDSTTVHENTIWASSKFAARTCARNMVEFYIRSSTLHGISRDAHAIGHAVLHRRSKPHRRRMHRACRTQRQHAIDLQLWWVVLLLLFIASHKTLWHHSSKLINSFSPCNPLTKDLSCQANLRNTSERLIKSIVDLRKRICSVQEKLECESKVSQAKSHLHLPRRYAFKCDFFFWQIHVFPSFH